MHLIENLDLEQLKNDCCTLEPLSYQHEEDLIQAATDGELWTLTYATIPKPNKMRDEIKRRLDLKAAGSMLPFAVIHHGTHRAIGMTTYCKINSIDKQLDIGWTWYARSHQRTAVNTQCKLMLITHAIESMGFETVYFKVHTQNLPSQNAVLRLGASFIGVIAHYQTMPDNAPQDYYHYSIQRADWPRIKQHLLSLTR